jgi:hypothetical protein
MNVLVKVDFCMMRDVFTMNALGWVVAFFLFLFLFWNLLEISHEVTFFATLSYLLLMPRHFATI